MMDWSLSAFGAALVGLGGWWIIGLGRSRSVLPADHAARERCEGETPVLDARALYARTGTWPVVCALRIQLGLSSQTFEALVLPMLDRFAEFVQLLPCTEDNGAEVVGGRLRDALHAAHRALDARRGRILPVGAAPEEIGERVHRWNVAVLLAALLGCVREALGTRVITYRKRQTHEERLWCPLAGSLVAHGAQCYRTGQAPSPSPESCDQLLPVILLQRLVPESTMAWLGEDTRVLRELLGVLAGDADCGGSVLAALMRPVHGNPVQSEDGIAVVSKDSDQSGGGVIVTDAARTALSADVVAIAGAESSADDVDSRRCPDGQGAVGTLISEKDVVRPVTSVDVAELEANVGTAVVAPDVTRRFMDWLQAGLAGGTLRCNASRALVHGVPEGMLLVSPQVFLAFARVDAGERGPDIDARARAARIRSIQRAVLRMGWHVGQDRGMNIVTYDIVRDSRKVGDLAGIVIERPERFVASAPPVNPLLVRALATPRSA